MIAGQNLWLVSIRKSMWVNPATYAGDARRKHDSLDRPIHRCPGILGTRNASEARKEIPAWFNGKTNM